MPHGTSLLSDLSVMLLCAAVATLCFKALKLPLFLGYLLAGFAVGPGLWGEHSPVHNRESIEQLSEFGLVFLMFYIGMEFDLNRLKRVLVPALLANLLQTGFLLFFGIQLAHFTGQSSLQGIFGGALLSISSTMVSVAVLQQMGHWKKAYAQLAVGVLLLEDIIAIILLVVLSGLAYSREGSGGAGATLEVLRVTFLIATFAVGVFFAGRLAAPKLLGALKKIGDVELITVSVVAFTLGIGMLAQQFEFSPALGAFLAGTVVSQTVLTHEIEKAMEPLRNIFCAVFFVSIGLLINPSDVIQNVGPIIGLSLVVVLAKVLTVAGGLYAAGQKAKGAFQAAVVKAQIGEFSFVIVSLGTQAGVTDSRWMAVAVGVSILTCGLSMLLSLQSEGLYSGIRKSLPDVVLTFGRFYQNFLEQLQRQVDASLVRKLIQRPLLQIILHTLLTSSLIVAASILTRTFEPVLASNDWGVYAVSALWLFAALLSLPFATAIIRNINAIILILGDILGKQEQAVYNRSRFGNITQSVVSIAVIVILESFYLTAMAAFMPGIASVLTLLVFSIVVGALFWKNFVKINNRLELLFMESFNLEAPNAAQRRSQELLEIVEKEYPWPVSVRETVVRHGAKAVGQSLKDLRLRERTGATVVAVTRGGHVIYSPPPGIVFFPGDHVHLFGLEAQTTEAEKMFIYEGTMPAFPIRHTFHIEQIPVGPKSEFVHQTLAGAALGQSRAITVLGILRGTNRITSPSPNEILRPGDILYAVGRESSIRELQRQGKLTA